MAGFLKGTMCAVLGLACSIAVAQNDDQQRDSKKSQDKEHKASQTQDQAQRQTIRGTVAGVTSIGEAVIDPLTNIAIVAEVDYLTILGSPAGDQHGKRSSHSDEASQDKDQADREKHHADQTQQTGSKDSKEKMSQRQNLYLVAITPDTKVQMAKHDSKSSSSQDNQASDKSRQEQSSDDAGSRQAFEKLEIGDKVRVEFVSARQMQGKGDSNQQASNADKRDEGQTRTAGFRGTGNQQKHGRNRIMIGEAKMISIQPTSSNEDSAASDSDQN